MSRPLNINPVEWELSLSMARAICTDFFKKGGTALDALKAYNANQSGEPANWHTAIEAIAFAHCQHALPRAA